MGMQVLCEYMERSREQIGRETKMGKIWSKSGNKIPHHAVGSESE